MSPDAYVHALYTAVLGREPDEPGLRHWVGFIGAGGDPTSVFAAVIESDEYRGRARTEVPGESRRVERLKSHLAERPLAIVDVGAQALAHENHIYQPLIAAGIPCRIIGFDPLAERLRERAAKEGDAHLTLLPYAVGDGSARVLHVNNVDSTSSLLPLNPAFTSNFPDLAGLRTVREETIETRRLDDVLPDDPIDFLKLDIQGFELLALQSATAALARTASVHCEVLFAPIYTEQPVFSQLDAFLAGQGFTLIDIVRPVHLPLGVPSGRRGPDRLIFADAFYLRVPTRAEGDRYLRQALIALLVYRKPGLAEWLLGRHDAAHGSNLASILSD